MNGYLTDSFPLIMNSVRGVFFNVHTIAAEDRVNDMLFPMTD